MSMDLRKTKIKTKAQFAVMLAALIADLVWLYTPMLLFLVFAVSYTSFNGALGEAVGFVLTIAIAVLGTRLWSPLAWKLSEPVISWLAKRVGVTSEKED